MLLKKLYRLESKGVGKRKFSINLRIGHFQDKGIREPIPAIHSNDQIIPLDESNLPLKLPDVDKYEPSETGESPLANIHEWLNIEGGRRETNTMPQGLILLVLFTIYLTFNETEPE